MSEDFAQRIREHYPEGLTGIFAIGGTRTTYILEQNRDADDPGKIADFAVHGRYMLKRYHDFMQLFFSLGGQNMIVTAFSFRGFYNRGQEYADFIVREFPSFINEMSCKFYRENTIDPYFAGIEPLLLSPEGSAMREVGEQFAEFQRTWNYQEGRYKLIWEIASIPLLTFWQMFQEVDEEKRALIQAELDQTSNFEEHYAILYRHFSTYAYGTSVPMPHFYLGTNKSGDLKWRSPMPITLSGGDYLRMFYTPYPTLFTKPATMQRILEDLAFKGRFFSDKTDYKGKYTRKLAQAEYERVMALSSDPENVLGLSRRVVVEMEDDE